MSHHFPNLLVATEFPPNASGGGPAVVRQMLKHWPTDQLTWWSCVSELDARFGQKVARRACALLPRKLMPNRRLTRAKAAAVEAFWAPWAARHLRHTLRSFRSDVIWVIPHNWAIFPISKALLQSNIPFHVTMQDYADVHQVVRQLGSARCRRMAKLATALYTTATTRDATSHPMIADLKARTGCDAVQMLHAGLEPEDFEYLDSKHDLAVSEIRIAYPGTIQMERTFMLFIEALAQIRAQLSTPVTLHFFGAHSYRARPWFDTAWMHENGNLPECELMVALRACTWGFVPMSLNDDNPQYDQFSFPTKFITCLAAGLPVITLGHPNSSVMRMAARYEVGLSTSASNPNMLSAQLASALFDPSPWLRYRAEILRCARSEFDANAMRRRLYSCFRTCAERALAP